MSTTTNFTAELVAMAQSHEELPHVKRALAEAQRTAEHANTIVARREESILALKAQIEALQAEKRSLEVARDDAEYKFLEADEKLDRILGMVKGQVEVLAPNLKVMEPPKPREAEPVAPPTQWAPPVGEPIAAGTESIPSDATSVLADWPEPAASTEPLGQSASDPVSATVETSLPNAVSDTFEGSVSPPISEPSQPYAGKCYWTDFTTYITRDEWLAGGGTIEDYETRPVPGSVA